MSLREAIEDKYKEAIKAKNTADVNTLRLIKSAIKDKEIALRTSKNKEGVGNEDILSILQNLIKQRKDSVESFKVASRDDLIAIELSEIEIISKFLPKQKSESESIILVEKTIKDNNLKSIKDMGILMNLLKKNYSGSLDMALVGKIAKSKLSL